MNPRESKLIAQEYMNEEIGSLHRIYNGILKAKLNDRLEKKVEFDAQDNGLQVILTDWQKLIRRSTDSKFNNHFYRIYRHTSSIIVEINLWGIGLEYRRWRYPDENHKPVLFDSIYLHLMFHAYVEKQEQQTVTKKYFTGISNLYLLTGKTEIITLGKHDFFLTDIKEEDR